MALHLSARVSTRVGPARKYTKNLSAVSILSLFLSEDRLQPWRDRRQLPKWPPPGEATGGGNYDVGDGTDQWAIELIPEVHGQGLRPAKALRYHSAQSARSYLAHPHHHSRGGQGGGKEG